MKNLTKDQLLDQIHILKDALHKIAEFPEVTFKTDKDLVIGWRDHTEKRVKEARKALERLTK